MAASLEVSMKVVQDAEQVAYVKTLRNLAEQDWVGIGTRVNASKTTIALEQITATHQQ